MLIHIGLATSPRTERERRPAPRGAIWPDSARGCGGLVKSPQGDVPGSIGSSSAVPRKRVGRVIAPKSGSAQRSLCQLGRRRGRGRALTPPRKVLSSYSVRDDFSDTLRRGAFAIHLTANCANRLWEMVRHHTNSRPVLARVLARTVTKWKYRHMRYLKRSLFVCTVTGEAHACPWPAR